MAEHRRQHVSKRTTKRITSLAPSGQELRHVNIGAAYHRDNIDMSVGLKSAFDQCGRDLLVHESDIAGRTIQYNVTKHPTSPLTLKSRRQADPAVPAHESSAFLQPCDLRTAYDRVPHRYLGPGANSPRPQVPASTAYLLSIQATCFLVLGRLLSIPSE